MLFLFKANVSFFSVCKRLCKCAQCIRCTICIDNIKIDGLGYQYDLCKNWLKCIYQPVATGLFLICELLRLTKVYSISCPHFALRSHSFIVVITVGYCSYLVGHYLDEVPKDTLRMVPLAIVDNFMGPTVYEFDNIRYQPVRIMIWKCDKKNTWPLTFP